MYVVNSFNVCGKSVSVLLTSTVYTVNPRFAFIRGGRFILSFATIRKDHNLLYLGDAELIKENVKFLNVGSSQVPGLIVMKVTKPEGYQSTDNELYVMLNAAPETRDFNAGDVEGASALYTGTLYADACNITEGKLSAGPWSVCVFAK